MTTALNKPNKLDGLAFLSGVANGIANLAIFDPQYRGGLDKLSYGNEGERQRARSKLPSMGDDLINQYVQELERGVKPSSYVCIWCDKFTLGENIWRNWTKGTGLSLVDLIVWRKPDIGQGYRSRRISEYLLVLQKPPTKAGATWKRTPMIPDVWTQNDERAAMGEYAASLWKKEKVYSLAAFMKNGHPHAKPVGLQAHIIRATTTPKDIVIDPAAGGYSVLRACQITGRNFWGADIRDWKV